jgi:hypothetical protein
MKTAEREGKLGAKTQKTSFKEKERKRFSS